jgi:CBS domain-containing protein
MILIAGILVTQFPQDYPLWYRVVIGATGSILFFVSMIISQILFNIIALILGIPLRNVTLFILGQATQVPEDGMRPSLEAIMGAVVLFLNVIMAGIFNWLYLGQSSAGNILILDLLQWIAYFWYLLALLHLMPFLPLAGGRILVAILWRTTGNYLRAIRITTLLGWGFSLILTVGGLLLLIISRQIENGVLLMYFGWALQQGTTLIRRRAILLASLKDIKAKNMISGEFSSIDPNSRLDQVIRDHILKSGQDYFAVTDKGILLGVLTIGNMKRAKKLHADSITVGNIMIPAAAVSTVQSEQSAAYILEQMDQLKVNSMPILKDNELIGIVMREKLIRLSRLRNQLSI